MDRYAFDSAICRQCGGLCCQGHPGAWAYPERFADLFLEDLPCSPDATKTLLARLGISLRDFSNVPVPAPHATDSGCVFLGPDGCGLPVEKRPCQCLALVPTLESLIDGECRCRLPGDFTYGAVRSRWLAWWEKTDPNRR